LSVGIIPPNHLVNRELPALTINSISILPLHNNKALISHLIILLNLPSPGTIWRPKHLEAMDLAMDI